MAAAMTFSALPSTVFTANADKGISPAGSNTVTAGANDQYYFLAQPEDIDLRETKTGLATAAVSFDYVKAKLINNYGFIVAEIPANEEDPGIVNAEITQIMAGYQMKFRVYYSDTEYIDTEFFNITGFAATEYPDRIYLSTDDHTATITYKTNFEPIRAEVFLGSEYSRDAVIEGSSVKVPVTESDAGQSINVHIFYGTDEEDYIIASTDVLMPFKPEFTQYIENTVIPEGEKETIVYSDLNFICSKFEVYADDKLIYTGTSGYDFITAPISESYIGADLFIRAYFDGDMFFPAETVDSEIFHIVRASSSHHFTKQPNDMDITKSDITDLEWEVDFTPLETEIVYTIGNFSLADPTNNSMSASEWFGYRFLDTGDYRIRTYYGAGVQDYIDSEVFHSVKPDFTVLPGGGYIHEGETLNVEWETNFKPVKLELWADETLYRTLDNDATSVQLGDTGAVRYYLNAYYCDDTSSYLTEPFSVKLTDKEIYNISADENIYISNMEWKDIVWSKWINAVEGDIIALEYKGDEDTFDRWDSALSKVVFDYENDIETTFTMPAHDVTIRYLKKASAPDGILGDVNGNGKINITDITLTAAHVKGKRLLTTEQMDRADINRDGKITVADIARIAAHVKGKKLIEQKV
jgi:hypothetical protein